MSSKLAAAVRALPSFYCSVKPSSLADVLRCEKKLNRELPSELREFLLTFGPSGGMVGDSYIAVNSPETISKVQRIREEFGVPSELLTFGTDGSAGELCYDFRVSPAVIVLTQSDDPDAPPRYLAETLAEFFELKHPLRRGRRRPRGRRKGKRASGDVRT